MWRAEEGAVRLELERFSAVIEPRDPASGLNAMRIDGVPLDDCSLLSVELQPVDAPVGAAIATRTSANATTEPGAIEPTEFDCYVRQGDLIATYPRRPTQEMRTQIYWRVDPRPRAGTLVAVELVTSVQTSLLDSNPRLSTGSQLIVNEAFKLVGDNSITPNFARIAPQSQGSVAGELSLAPHCFLLRPATSRFSYVEVVAPDNVEKTDWDCGVHGSDFRMRLHHELFSEQLEKGVILRSRTLGALVDRDGDMAAAARLYVDFLSAELPLTA